MKNPILYVVVNGGLKMSAGKTAAQVAHAVMSLENKHRKHFMDDYKRTVVVLEATGREQMDGIVDYLISAHVDYEYYVDEGKNEVEAFSMTALAVQPVRSDDTEKREIFEALPLYGERNKANFDLESIFEGHKAFRERHLKEQKTLHLEAENRELRHLWQETEADVIELKSMFSRFLRMNKRTRAKVKNIEDPRLLKD